MKKFIKSIFVISILSTIFFLSGCEDFKYELNSDKTGYILKEYKGTSESVIIPDTYKGLPITEIGASAFYDKSNILGNLIIPESITKIGDFAFTYTGFTKVILSKNLKIIGEWAFAHCENLTNVIFYDGICF